MASCCELEEPERAVDDKQTARGCGCELRSSSDHRLMERVAEEQTAAVVDTGARCENLLGKQKPKKDLEFSDPVYKKISRINGEINRMTKTEVREKLHELKLDTGGVKEVIKKRLKNYYKKQKLRAHNKPQKRGCPYDYLLVIDFEATCDTVNIDYEHEIIEFPIIMVDVEERKVVDEFHAYCKPQLNPRLTEFCTKLTGITQEQVNQASRFTDVLNQVEEWMNLHRLWDKSKFAVLTDGPWDMHRFMFFQCKLSDIPYPKWAKRWINIRKHYTNFYQCKRSMKLMNMLETLGMNLEGTLHCGLDDARNIARIAIRMLSDGCPLVVNENLDGKFEIPHHKSDSRSASSGKPKNDWRVKTICDSLHKVSL